MSAMYITRREMSALLTAAAATAQTQPQRAPRQDLELVAEFVRLAHMDSNLDKIAAMLADKPNLVYATHDWGGGDWETGLGGASHVGSRKMAHLLLEKGARADAYCSAMLGQRDVIGALIAADAAVVNARGPHGYSLLYHAASSGDVKMAEMIKPHLANAKRDFDQSLSAAVRDNRVEMTAWLLDNGVSDANLPDMMGTSPLAIAQKKGFNDVAEVLRKHGAR